MGTVVPLDLQRREPFLRGSHMVGHDGDGVVEPHDLTHGLDGLGRRIVYASYSSAKNGRLRERRKLHALRPAADPLNPSPIHLPAPTHPLTLLAHQLQVPR